MVVKRGWPLREMPRALAIELEGRELRVGAVEEEPISSSKSEY